MELKRKPSKTLETTNGVHQATDTEQKTTETHGSGGSDGGKFENISDNGSEISDEGYRSLGLIQQAKDNQSKRISLHSQTSNEDVKLESVKNIGEYEFLMFGRINDANDYIFSCFDFTVRLDQARSDTPTTPSDDVVSKGTDLTLSPDAVDAIMPIDEAPVKTFERANIFITDDDITVNVSSATGLRKTGFSDDLYAEDSGAKRSLSKIPRSPMTRRRSVECETPATGLPLTRKGPTYRSVRKQSPAHTKSPVHEPVATSTPAKDSNIGTWNGRALHKKRASLGNETLQTSPTNKATTVPGKPGFQRNTDVRASYNLYDQNGRRIKSTNTSPVKQNSSPLAQQILEAAENAKNDTQMLEKMKRLLSKYTTPAKTTKATDGMPSATKSKEYEDFTTAWVNSNGSLDRVTSCCSPPKVHSKRSSAASSIESTHSRCDGGLPSQRRERGISRIPAPIRQNTDLY